MSVSRELTVSQKQLNKVKNTNTIEQEEERDSKRLGLYISQYKVGVISIVTILCTPFDVPT